MIVALEHGQLRAAKYAVHRIAGQTVAIRTQAVADLYFSSEAYDDCGPDGEVFRDYPDHVSIQMPDPRDWEIVEALATNDELEDFDPADVQRVTGQIMITDEQFQKLVAEARIKPEDLEEERKKNQEETERIFALATRTTYQLSCGKRRSVYVNEPENLYNAFYELIEFDGGDPDGMIVLPAEGWHRTIFINKNALDYVMLPTHQFEAGRTEADALDLESDRGRSSDRPAD